MQKINTKCIFNKNEIKYSRWEIFYLKKLNKGVNNFFYFQNYLIIL